MLIINDTSKIFKIPKKLWNIGTIGFNYLIIRYLYCSKVVPKCSNVPKFFFVPMFQSFSNSCKNMVRIQFLASVKTTPLKEKEPYEH